MNSGVLAASGDYPTVVDFPRILELLDEAGIQRLAVAFAPVHPYLRGAPPGLPFTLDAATIRRGLNFTLTTDVGDVDLLGEITGGGGFHALAPHAIELRIFGRVTQVLDLPTLIRTKRAAGRPKDLDAIAELETLLDESGGDQS